MEQFIRDHIDYFTKLYIKTLNSMCLEVIENLKKLGDLYAGKDTKKPKDSKVVVKWC